MIALATTVLLASLLGSLHCAGMCGGFVALYAADLRGPASRGAALPHALYNGGRLVAYTVLGALAGALGAATDFAGGALGLPRTALWISAVFIVVWGVVALLQALGAPVRLPEAPVGARRLLARACGRVSVLDPARRALAIGLLTALLPCGWLYAFVVTAAGTGSAPRGALVMALFWAGTLPMMVAVGAGVQALAAPLRRYAPVVAALAMIAAGLSAVAGHARAVPARANAAPTCHVSNAAR